MSEKNILCEKPSISKELDIILNSPTTTNIHVHTIQSASSCILPMQLHSNFMLDQ